MQTSQEILENLSAMIHLDIPLLSKKTRILSSAVRIIKFSAGNTTDVNSFGEEYYHTTERMRITSDFKIPACSCNSVFS